MWGRLKLRSLLSGGLSNDKKHCENFFGDAQQPKFSRVAVNYAGDTAIILWFTNADTDYLLNFPTKGGPALEVKQHGKTISQMACQGGLAAAMGEHDQPEKPDADYAEAQKYWQY